MTVLGIRFDQDLWRWDLSSGSPVGPAGTASTGALDDVIQVHVDALTGGVVTVTIDADGPDGQLGEAAAEWAWAMLEGDVRDGGSVRLREEVEGTLARLAVLTSEWQRQQALGRTSAAWASERDGLVALLRGSSTASVPEQQVPDVSSFLAEARRRFTEQPVRMGRLVEDGPVLVDPSWVPHGVLELGSLRSSLERDEDRLVIETGIRSDIYAVEVRRVEAALIDESTDLVVALAPFDLDMTNAGHCARADLIFNGSRPLDSVSLWVTGDPTRPPSKRLRQLRASVELGRRAAQAQRLGLSDTASSLRDLLLAPSHVSGWSDARPPVAEALRVPFAGEVLDLAGET